MRDSIFTVKDVTERYRLHPKDRKWITNMVKKSYLELVEKRSPYKYKLTDKAIELIRTLKNWKNDLENLKTKYKISDLRLLLNSLKLKGKSTE